MKPGSLVGVSTVLLAAAQLSCSADAPTGPEPSFKAGVAARGVTVDFSSFGDGKVFQPDFYRSDGIRFLEQCGTTGCAPWFIGCCPAAIVVGEDVVDAPLKATFTRPISDLSLRAGLGFQGTVTLILSAFDASDHLLATTSVTVTQDEGDPANMGFDDVTVSLANLSKPAKSFSLVNVFVRSSFPQFTHIPVDVSSISYTHWGRRP